MFILNKIDIVKFINAWYTSYAKKNKNKRDETAKHFYNIISRGKLDFLASREYKIDFTFSEKKNKNNKKSILKFLFCIKSVEEQKNNNSMYTQIAKQKIHTTQIFLATSCCFHCHPLR